MNGDEAWNSHYAKHWYVVATNRIGTEAYAYQPGKDGIPIYQTWDEYQDYDQGISGRKIQLLEIGWNIPATAKAKSLKFEVTMTLVGATMLYSDVAKFQWEPVSELNETSIGKVTGTKTWLRSSPDRRHPALAGSQGRNRHISRAGEPVWGRRADWACGQDAAVGFAGGESDAEWERGCGFGALGLVSCLCHGDGHVQTNAAGTCQSISADSEP